MMMHVAYIVRSCTPCPVKTGFSVATVRIGRIILVLGLMITVLTLRANYVRVKLHKTSLQVQSMDFETRLSLYYLVTYKVVIKRW